VFENTLMLPDRSLGETRIGQPGIFAESRVIGSRRATEYRAKPKCLTQEMLALSLQTGGS
jgi:hypothetical protein